MQRAPNIVQDFVPLQIVEVAAYHLQLQSYAFYKNNFFWIVST